MAVHMRNRLAADGFVEVGRFAVGDGLFSFQFTVLEAEAWLHTVYAWVGRAPLWTVLRIGKCQGKLRTRIAGYKRSLDQAMNGGLAPNECFKGDTTPRERDGWIAYASAPEGGLIFAQQVGKASLREVERRLIKAYDPPLCNDSQSGRRLQRAWRAEHGPLVRRSRRE